MTVTAAPSTSGSVGVGRAGGGRILFVVILIAVAVGMFLTTRATTVPPFSIDSTRPTGYGALRILLTDNDVEVVEVSADALTDGDVAAGPDSVVVVAVPAAASDEQLDALDALAADGATVVFGEPVGLADTEMGSATDQVQFLNDRVMADTPSLLVGRGICDIVELADLGPVDAAFAPPVQDDGAEQTCYTDGAGSLFLRNARGEGSVITLASPLLWANARLQPQKETGGEPPANGATAIRLLGSADRVTFIEPVSTGSSPVAGTQDPISLLPLPVKLALVQLVAAFGLFIWWRSRRLGSPVSERLPVEIAGSELVVAVGDLLRRRGNPQRAATTVHAETRRVLGERLGMGPAASPAALVAVVAARTGREPAEVAAALVDDPAAPVTNPDALVRLARTLDSIRQEVLDVASPR